MEEQEHRKLAANREIGDHWIWAGAGAGQLVLGIFGFRKGHYGNPRLLPYKAFAVASLFVGAAASAVVASFRASGVRSAEDVKAMGKDIRTNLGLKPRPSNE